MRPRTLPVAMGTLVALASAQVVVGDGDCGLSNPPPAVFKEFQGDLRDEEWPDCQPGDPPPSCECTLETFPLYCGEPTITLSYELFTPTCDPTSSSCTVVARIDVVQPGIEDTVLAWEGQPHPKPTTPRVYWWENRAAAPNCDWNACQFSQPNFTCGDHFTGGKITTDTYRIERFLSGVTCSNAQTRQLESARLYVCATSTACGVSRPVNGIGGKPMAAAIGCPIPPPDG